MEAAVQRSFELAKTDRVAAWGEGSSRIQHATVVLAPACASFDMFRDYAERGQVFKKEVLKLAKVAERRGAIESREKTTSGEQSSVGHRRMGVGCWEHRLPRSVKLVSQPLD